MMATTMALFMSTAGYAAVATSAGLEAEYFDLQPREYVLFASSDCSGALREANGALGGMVTQSFQGINQSKVATCARNFIPPDTMAVVGTT